MSKSIEGKARITTVRLGDLRVSSAAQRELGEAFSLSLIHI